MRLRFVGMAALLCALPASGENTQLPPDVVRALTSFDSSPTPASINNVFTSPLDSLRILALDRTIDLGIELRAIRALPAYCPPAPQICGPGTITHDTLTALIDDYPQSRRTPGDLLRLRAAIEALGAVRSKLGGDVDKLLPLLGHSSRDVRTTVVRALRNLCNPQALEPLRSHYAAEPTDQVKRAIAEALRELRTCT